jgi:hypothetical protein
MITNTNSTDDDKDLGPPTLSTISVLPPSLGLNRVKSVHFEDEEYNDLSCTRRLHLRLLEYEKKFGGQRKLSLHFLTNRFYLNKSVEDGYQEWCTKKQLPTSRMLAAVVTTGLCFYQAYSAFKSRDEKLWIAFGIRVAATMFFALDVSLLFCVPLAKKNWKYMLSLGLVVLFGVECYYRSVKTSYEGELIADDTMLILDSENTIKWNISEVTRLQAKSNTFDIVFKKLNVMSTNFSSITSFQTALTLKQDELLLIHSRSWPMWTVIISVVMRIDIYLIFPSMVSVLAIYLSLSAYYHRNGFQDGINGDIQTQVLVVGQLCLILWLAYYNDLFLRWTYIQIVDSNNENLLLRERLTLLGDKRYSDGHDSEVIIKTPMEIVLQKLNNIKKVLVNTDPTLNKSLGPVLENVIDILATQSASGPKFSDNNKNIKGLSGLDLDSDVSSWLINQAGLGDK